MGLAGVCIFAITLLIFSSRISEGLPLAHSQEKSSESAINKREIQIETGSIQISGAADGVNSTSVRIVYGQPAVTNQPSKPSSKNNWRHRRYSDMTDRLLSRQQDALFSNDEDNMQENISDQQYYDNIMELENLEKRMTPNSSPSLDSFVAMRGKKKSRGLFAPRSATNNSLRSKRKQPDDLDNFYAMRGRKRRTPFHNKGHIGDIFIGMRGW